MEPDYFTVMGTLNGRLAYSRFETVTAAVAEVDKLHKLGVMPVHIKRN